MNLKRGFERLEYAVSILYWVLAVFLVTQIGIPAVIPVVVIYLVLSTVWSGLKWVIMGFAKE